ncbi:MAG: tRNA glutamyl-Q(34) synthetase GluQRS [Phycisphaerae bacterium]|nr:tRNA glutamyl-Q(34) synthetase GluQRS [Phycisphaerae bacterium]
MSPSPLTTRLAPSPTGALHLGNARTFLVNWLLARQQGWRVLFRMEDLDGPRVRPAAARQAIRELAWLGLTWEGEIVYQSQRTADYEQALEKLIAAGAAYPCTCSRKGVERAASAPAKEDGLSVYPGTCRNRYAAAEQARAESGQPPAWRVRVSEELISFDDRFAGPRTLDLSKYCGDFVIFRREGLAAYQLAVVVDDAAAGVDAVVRGDDLLPSAAMQIHLRSLLGLGPAVTYWHVPLIVGPDGRKLAKRHGDTRISHYIEAGATPPRVLGLLAYWSGLLQKRKEIDLADLLEKFDLSRLPKEKIVFSPADDNFLLA